MLHTSSQRLLLVVPILLAGLFSLVPASHAEVTTKAPKNITQELTKLENLVKRKRLPEADIGKDRKSVV